MSSGHTITITPSDAHVEVTLDGEVLASSDSALRLDETGLPARYYLPEGRRPHGPARGHHVPHDLPVQGEASYWSVTVGGTRHDGIVWGYETPIDAAKDIAGFLSFYPDRTEISVDGTPLS